MTKYLNEDEICRILAEMSDAEEELENLPSELIEEEIIFDLSDDEQPKIEPGPSRITIATIEKLQSKDFPAESTEDDPEKHFTGTNKKDIRWMKCRTPAVIPDFGRTFEDLPGNTEPLRPFAYFSQY